MCEKRAGYSLAELLLVVALVGILTFVAVPRLDVAAIYRQESHTVAKRIVTDLRRTRMLAISDAANNTAGYRLVMMGGSPYSGYEIVNADSSTVVDTLTIEPTVSCTGGSTFRFGPLGNLLSGGDTQLVVSGGARSYTISVVSGTGAVKCIEN